MNYKILRHIRFIVTGLIVMFAGVTAVFAAQSTPPPLPASFYGTLAGDVNEDVTIAAVLKNKTVVQTTPRQNENEWVYSLIIPGDIAHTKAIEGGSPGDTIEFHINGEMSAQTAVWQSGSNTRLNLTTNPDSVIKMKILLWLGRVCLLLMLIAVFYVQRSLQFKPKHLRLQENQS